MAFQILALSGGGYRGLFTADVLARIEEKANRPIGDCFDLIAGTSIGGIIAIGIAMGKTAKEIRSVFLAQGEAIFPFRAPPPEGWIAKKWHAYKTYCGGPKYNSVALREAVEKLVGPRTLIGDAKTRLLVPAINMTYGKVQMFKTPHHRRLETDYKRSAVDVAMATSAAPLLFPLAKIGDSFYADGGLVANSPDGCALHEAIYFCGQNIDDIKLLSVGTTTSRFALPASLGGNFGPAEWLMNERLVTTVFCAQQQMVDFMVGHQLGDRYLRIDEIAAAEQAVDLGLDIADRERRSTLLGMAEGAYQKIAGHDLIEAMLAHSPIPPNFPGRKN